MAQLILVRHGQTDWSSQKRLQGALDIPLNEEGKREAQKISGELTKFRIDALYSSPISCCLSTADEIAGPHKLKTKAMEGLSELNHGVWEGLLVKDIKKRYKKQYSTWKTSPVSTRPPKGEAIKDVSDRAICAIHKILDKYKGENICVVSHDVTLAVIKCYYKNIELDRIWGFISGNTWWEIIEL